MRKLFEEAAEAALQRLENSNEDIHTAFIKRVRSGFLKPTTP
jgi:hypothetical protein